MLTIVERTNGTRRVQTPVGEKSMTEQSHRKKCNINTIIAKAKKTGRAPANFNTMNYGDFSNAESFHEAKTKVLDAHKDFLELPSDIRNRFQNDPGQLLDFLADPENQEEAAEMGLVEPLLPFKDEVKAPEGPEKGKEPEKVREDPTE